MASDKAHIIQVIGLILVAFFGGFSLGDGVDWIKFFSSNTEYLEYSSKLEKRNEGLSFLLKEKENEVSELKSELAEFEILQRKNEDQKKNIANIMEENDLRQAELDLCTDKIAKLVADHRKSNSGFVRVGERKVVLAEGSSLRVPEFGINISISDILSPYIGGPRYVSGAISSKDETHPFTNKSDGYQVKVRGKTVSLFGIERDKVIFFIE